MLVPYLDPDAQNGAGASRILEPAIQPCVELTMVRRMSLR